MGEVYETSKKVNKNSSRLASWGRLARAHTVLATSLIPIVAFISTGSKSVLGILQVFVIASLFHMSICAMNDYIDYTSDKYDAAKSARPIVSGEISRHKAKLFVIVTAMLGLTAAGLTGQNVFIVAVVGFGAATAYNYESAERTRADVWYVLAIILIAILGIVTAGTYTDSTILLMVALTIHGLFQVQEGHMKDLKEDESNIIQYLGVSVLDDRSVSYPIFFKPAAYMLKTVELALLIAVLYTSVEGSIGFSIFSVTVVLVAFVGNILLYYYSLNQYMVDKFSRSEIVRNITFHEVSSVMLILIAVMPRYPFMVMALVVLTPTSLVLVNSLIHRDLVSPDI